MASASFRLWENESMDFSELGEHNRKIIERYLSDKRMITRIKVRPIMEALAEEKNIPLTDSTVGRGSVVLLFKNAWKQYEDNERERYKKEGKSDLNKREPYSTIGDSSDNLKENK